MTALRALAALGLLLLGGGTAVAAVAVHTRWWGLPLATAAMLAVLVAVGTGWLTRLPLALGFVGTVALALPRRSEGDYLVSSGTPGSLLLVLALVTLVVAVVTLPRPRRGAESARVRPPT